MPRSTARGYAPAISLRDLVDELGTDALASVVGACAGAVALTPKANECWRYVLNECVVLGYASSATVTGVDVTQMRAVEALIRIAVQEAQEGSARVRSAVMVARMFVEQSVAVARDRDATETGVVALLRVWSDLDVPEQSQAFAHLAQSLPDVRAKVWYVQIVQAVLAAYAHGIVESSSMDDTPERTARMPSSGAVIAVRSA